jgi:hypothetical protein
MGSRDDKQRHGASGLKLRLQLVAKTLGNIPSHNDHIPSEIVRCNQVIE